MSIKTFKTRNQVFQLLPWAKPEAHNMFSQQKMRVKGTRSSLNSNESQITWFDDAGNIKGWNYEY